MKTTTRKAVWSLYGLCLIMLAYACRNDYAEPLRPYTFDSLRNLQLPSAKVSAPPPVVVLPSTITASAKATQVKSAITTIPGSGQVPLVVSVAAGDMASALSSAGIDPASFIGQFTPQVILMLTTQGVLPSGLQTQVNALVLNPTLQQYLVGFTYPQINSQEIGPATISVTGAGTVGTVVLPVAISPVNYQGTDQCVKAANDLFDSKIAGLETARQGQVAATIATYNQAKAAAEGDVSGCVSGNVSKYTALATTARQNLDASLASLAAAQATLGSANYNLLLALTYLEYSQELQLYFKLQLAEINSCALISQAKIEAAKFARDTDVNSINDAFNTTIKTAQAIVLQLYDACHNQGSGR